MSYVIRWVQMQQYTVRLWFNHEAVVEQLNFNCTQIKNKIITLFYNVNVTMRCAPIFLLFEPKKWCFRQDTLSCDLRTRRICGAIMMLCQLRVNLNHKLTMYRRHWWVNNNINNKFIQRHWSESTNWSNISMHFLIRFLLTVELNYHPKQRHIRSMFLPCIT